MTWLTAFKDKNIVVLGAGMTGLSCLRFLHAQGLSFGVNDSRAMPFNCKSEQTKYELDFPQVNFIFGQWDKSLIANADILIASPGIDLVKEGVEALISKNCRVIGDIELFCLVNNSRINPVPMLAVTGSNGKSTVVSLLAYLAKSLGINAALAGNIGEPILDLLASASALTKANNKQSISQLELVIVELSSFQLETLSSMNALAASVLNLSDDHLDRHKTLAVYQALKQGIYPQAKIAVVNREEQGINTLVPNQNIISFGLSKPELGHFGLEAITDSAEQKDHQQLNKKQTLMFGDQALIAINELPLAGMHNALNYMAALALGYVAGWSLSAMTENLAGFVGLAHRCQRVVTSDQIHWINDSKATNVGATLAAIHGLAPTISIENNLILIAGGDGKGADFSPLSAIVNTKVSHLITLGKDGDEIANLVNTPKNNHQSKEYPSKENQIKAIQVNTLIEAVVYAKKIAKPGDMVLLSPACASIDMFKNYMVRGEQFITAITADTQIDTPEDNTEETTIGTKEGSCP